MDSIIPLTSRNVFLIGGITHVPPEEFPMHLEFFGEMSMLLQYRYGLNPSFALRDNEIRLMKLPREQAKYECYRIDQDSVVHSGLVIAELSVPSTGTGQEMERAYLNNIPIIAMAKKELRETVTPTVTYFAERSVDGSVVESEVKRGAAGVSLMVEGNPVIIEPFIVYSKKGAEGRTDALRMLDGILQERFGLTPITRKLDAAIKIDGQLIDGIDSGKMPEVLKGRDPAKEKTKLQAQIAKNRKRREMLESLTVFDPKAHDPAEYEKMFPHLRRLPLADIEYGEKRPTFREVRAQRVRERQK